MTTRVSGRFDANNKMHVVVVVVDAVVIYHDVVVAVVKFEFIPSR